MIAANRPGRLAGKVLVVGASGEIRHHKRADLATLLEPGDLVVGNDAATLPASLHGIHAESGEPIEVRLAGWIAAGDFSRFVAVVFGSGDYRTPTEDRAPPPLLSPGNRLLLGPLTAVVERVLDHPRLISLHFPGDRKSILAGLVRRGRPIQYAHVPVPLALWDVWTSLAAQPMAFEPPSAGFALDWRLLAAWRCRGVGFATLTHAAGISSTGDPALDLRLPFEEPYVVPESTAAAINRAKSDGRRIIAVGTTVVRALESAVNADGTVRPGDGVARNRIGPETALRVVDAILTGVHQPRVHHFELLRAFTEEVVLEKIAAAANDHDYRTHEFGDTVLIERHQPGA